jgi:plastocyanin
MVLAFAMLGSAGAAQTHTVVIEGMQFSPQALTVQHGDRIVWQNKDLVPHTATAAGSFDSGTIEAGKSWSYVANKAGTLAYVCTLHPTMKATLIVK